MGVMQVLWSLAVGLLRLFLCYIAGSEAYHIRLHAVINYGRVIHEFDPWFNYRAAEYLAAHGSEKFFKWFDHTVWYPLGRPVGTTIYPGMQFASVWIWRALQHFGIDMSLNDVCVFTPAWFGVVATVFLGLLTYETTRSVDSAVAASLIMAIIPAHIMRSVAGGYDNECVAISAMCATFYFWCRSLRDSWSWPVGVITGVAYFCMVAAWGGYIYVLNMIGVHAAFLIVMDRYSSTLHRAYSLFYVIGTALAIQIPVVGLTPIRSLEQMAPMAVFWWLQMLEFCHVVRRLRDMDDSKFKLFQRQVFGACGAVGVVIAAFLFQLGYFGPISARVRGLFVQHTRTGNPLVDSVAEHQATSPRAYWQYLHYMCYLAPIGFGLSLAKPSDSKWFLIIYSAVTYYFSAKMNRLVLLMGPCCSALGGVAVSSMVRWALGQVYELWEALEDLADPSGSGGRKEEGDKSKTKAKAKGKAEASGKAKDAKSAKKKNKGEFAGLIADMLEPFHEAYNEVPTARRVGAIFVLIGLLYFSADFYIYCNRTGAAMSQPSIMFKSRVGGKEVMIDDYREAYWWLRDNTPEDSRVMAWWDYGYQINGVGNRTTIADGNTWNHEHIATLGRCLTNPEKKAHNIIRHLADYVLLWTGGGGDDLAKSPHMARIANSVYSDVCPDDPTCSSFAVDQKGNPTKMMGESLLWKLHGHNQKQGVHANPRMFTEAYTSKHNLVRIFKVVNVSQESKDWAMNPQHWKCDAPGSWYCEGQYPPSLTKLLEKRKAFKQLEDFNAGKDKEAEEYQKAYHAKMSGQSGRGF